jgi:integral membrane protein (TIGR01906 family)
MIDVKLVVQAAMNFWYVSLAGLLFLLLWALRGGWTDTFLQGLARGGWLTIFAVGAVILFVLIGFGFFFVFFHDVFFDPGTWMFEYSDTLIRLFPERFWRDAFLAIGMISVLGGLGLALGLRRR